MTTTTNAPKQPATPLQRLMRRIHNLPLCPLCKREKCECWQPLVDADKEHAALADLAPLHRQLVEALEEAQAHLAHPTLGAGCRAVDAALDAARKAGL